MFSRSPTVAFAGTASVPLSAGTDSPVSAASSVRRFLASTSRKSAGILSPDSRVTTSPGTSCSAGIMRGGETRMIPAEQLVPGDVVTLESGDKIPADLRLVDAKNLRTEEAALTGESVPADKGTDTVPANATLGDRENMAFSGT